jgi:hypothetical protein
VELKRQNVDVNPEYSDSLDHELFTVHLMFEKPSMDTTGHMTPGDCNTMVQRYGNTLLPHRYLTGRDAFEAGLDEITKHHDIQPDPSKSAALVDMGYGENYATVALQLSNNLLDLAAEFIQRMKARSTELQNSTGAPARPHSASVSLLGGDKSYEGLSFAASGARVTPAKGLPAAFSVDGAGGSADAAAAPVAGSVPESEDALPNPVCPICKEDSIVKADQLIPCRACSIQYHTTCFGARRIPFSLKTIKERQNRDKYISKHYGTWRCESCTKNNIEIRADGAVTSPVGGPSTPDPSASGSAAVDAAGAAKLARPVIDNSVSPLTKNRHEQVALMLGLLSSSGLTVEQLMSMGEDKQREVLIAATAHHNARTHVPGDGTGSGEGYVGTGSGGAAGHDGSPVRNGVFNSIAASTTAHIGSQHNTRDTMYAMLASDKLKAAGTAGVGAGGAGVAGGHGGVGAGAVAGGGHASSAGTAGGAGGAAAQPAAGGDSGAVDPRAAMMALLAKRSGAAEPAPAAAAPAGGEASAAHTGPKLKDEPSYAKFFKMLKVGLPKASIAQKMFSEGVVASVADAVEVLNMDPEGPIPVFRAKGAADGAAGGADAGGDGAGDANGQQGADVPMMPVGEHPRYNKYFKMLKVGLPIDMVKSKVAQEGGLNPEFMAKDPAELVPVDETKHTEQPDSGNSAGGGGEMVAVSEHPKYSKYFRMLKVGLPVAAVKIKMESEGVDPSYLDKDPNEMIPLEAEVPMVAVAEHPKYTKYFKMLKVGLGKDAIKVKMAQEGVDPSYLDKEPTDMVPVEEPKGKDGKTVSPIKKEIIKKPKTRKLHWKAIDASKLTENSVWMDKDTTDIKLDMDEFTQLFVEQ